MAVIGVHITKINAEKKKAGSGQVIITNNITIQSINEHDFSLGQATQKGLRFGFKFVCDYSPDYGSINLEGDVLFIGDEKRVKEIKKIWDSDKKLSDDMVEPILNSALNKCNIEALKISQDINLPSPVMLPRLEKKAKGREKA